MPCFIGIGHPKKDKQIPEQDSTSPEGHIRMGGGNMTSAVIQEIAAKNIITKTDIPVCDYAVNPYVGCTHGCKYCYASFMKRFTNHPEPWGTFLDVKYWPEIRKPEKYAGKELFFGTVTDPYNPQEEQYCRTRALLEQLQGSGVKITIQTKSDLVLRDIDLLRTFPGPACGLFHQHAGRRLSGRHGQRGTIERRLTAMKVLHEEGIRTTCFISPIFPALTDVFAIIGRVKDQCQLVWLENLNLRGSYKAVILGYIQHKHSELTGCMKKSNSPRQPPILGVTGYAFENVCRRKRS